MKLSIEQFKDAVRENNIKVGDKLITEDIAGKAIFEVGDIRKNNIYMVRKYVLPDDYDKNHYEMDEFLNDDYLDSLPDELVEIMGERNEQKIFVPRFIEVFGDIDCSWADKGKGRQWEIFKKTKGKIRLSENKYGRSRFWWLCSPYISFSAYFCGVSASGTPGSGTASGAFGLLPCFKVNRSLI